MLKDTHPTTVLPQAYPLSSNVEVFRDVPYEGEVPDKETLPSHPSPPSGLASSIASAAIKCASPLITPVVVFIIALE